MKTEAASTEVGASFYHVTGNFQYVFVMFWPYLCQDSPNSLVIFFPTYPLREVEIEEESGIG